MNLHLYRSCDFISCDEKIVVPRLTSDQVEIQDAINYYYNNYEGDTRFTEPVLPGDCTKFEKVVHVDSHSNCSINCGSKGSPYASINTAVDNLEPVESQNDLENYKCTLVMVHPGQYNEKVTLSMDTSTINRRSNSNVTVFAPAGLVKRL